MNKSDSLKDSNEELKKSVRLQESSQEIEDRHQDLLGHIKAIQYTHDLQGQFLSVNQEITEFLGYDKNSLLNMNIRNLLAPEVRHEFDTYLTEIKRQGTAKGLMLVQTATGEKRILIYNNTLQTEGVATPTVQGIAYDITKYIQTERALRQVSGQLSIVLESLPIVCYIGEAEGDYGATYITHNIKAITGFEDTNFTSKSSFWADRIHPEDAPRIFANLPQIFEKKYHEHQYRWQVADGSYKWFYDYMRVIISSNGKKCIIGMMQDITERKRAEEALLNAAQQWRTTFDGISDFVSLLDLDGKILRCNKAMKDFVGKPFNEIINHSCWEIILGTTTPIEDCPFLRMKETLHRETTILSVNDLWFNVSVDPIFDQASRLIGAVNIISDITKRKQAEEAVNRLAQENAVVAEIGRIINSTLNIEEVYERFAEEVSKLISFDRISINIVNPDNNTATTVYISGIDVPGRRMGDITPLKGTAISECIRTRSSMLIQPENVDEYLTRFPALLPTFQASLKSIMYVPLISKDQVIGALSLRSTKTNAYTDRDVKLAESIGNQIAGAIANAQLFIERKRAEEALQRSEEEARRLAQENATVAEIGRIISSTLNIEEVYERFAEEVRKLIPLDRIALTTITPDHRSGTIAYVLGVEVKDRNQGAVFPLTGSFYEEIFSKRSGILVQTEDESELAERYPILLSTLQVGLRSMISVPLISKGQVVGVLHIRSLKPKAYTESDLSLAERVGNQIAGAIANAQLYFERRQVEEALRRSEGRYRTILEDIQEGYFEVDLPGNFTFVNDAECRNLGYPKEELIGMSNRQYTDEKNAKKMYDLFNEVYRTGELAKGYDLEFIKKDGTKTFSEISVSLVRDSEGKQIGFRGISRDVTERKRMEEQLLQAEKLRAVGEMASGVAHDFNNALAAILGNTQLLLYTTHDEELKETLKIIEKVAKDSGQTIRRLQDFTRKRVDQELFKVDVNSIIKDSMEMTKPKWKDEPQSRGICIEMVPNLEEIPSVSGNGSELREVITNMIFNAIEAMPEGGKIEICTFKKRRNVFIQISDSGIGISEEAKRKIFEPFFTTKPFTNTGLGLSMSYGIIKRFGGEIEVESKVGQGTTFTIILPIGGEEKEEAVFPQTIKKGREARILVIDDDEFVRNVLSRTLAQANHQVTLAENGEKGVQLFKEGKFDIVLTDLGMPGMSGWEVCRIIKEISPHTLVGMITGWGVEKNRNEVEEYGLDFFISKPFDFNQILNVVSETMASKEE